DDVKVVNERLVAAFGGDVAPTHAAAWMRLTGTVHQPKPRDADDPVRNVATPIVFVEGPGDGVVTVQEFHRALDRLQATPSGRELDARENLVGMRDGDGRNGAMTKLAGH